ncbi:unnamed protein product, partial [Allacma fusca]
DTGVHLIEPESLLESPNVGSEEESDVEDDFEESLEKLNPNPDPSLSAPQRASVSSASGRRSSFARGISVCEEPSDDQSIVDYLSDVQDG